VPVYGSTRDASGLSFSRCAAREAHCPTEDPAVTPTWACDGTPADCTEVFPGEAPPGCVTDPATQEEARQQGFWLFSTITGESCAYAWADGSPPAGVACAPGTTLAYFDNQIFFAICLPDSVCRRDCVPAL
jgi:hypothetical protein